MDYPENCLRGVPNSTYINANGLPTTHLFYFEDEDKRDDGWIEQSINWEDDNKAIELIFNQKKSNGEKQFKAGAAILIRERIDWVKKTAAANSLLSYERKPEDGNPYHGNLLLKNEVLNPIMKQIAAGLALAAVRVESPPEDTD